MYKIEYLQTAKRDLEEIGFYISVVLKNPTAAIKTTSKIVETIENLKDNPYICATYRTRKKLKHEIRYIVCGSYLSFFWVTESCKTITVAAVLYGKRNILEIL